MKLTMNWGTGIFLSFLGFIVVIMTMVTISVRMDGIELVTESYYEKEIVYQDQIDKEQATLDQNKDVMTFDMKGQMILVDLPSGASGTLHLFRPSDAALDQKIKLDGNSQRSIEVPINQLKSGYWKAQLNWVENGVEYYQEKKLNF
ncbi:FixH family protein [Algoriphagus halophilus]|uniref:FixH protein n=1 Tax=Algoriphagus halophilus TaxID=226505 RepID=A0A1N6EQ88_9BACT|nr:FixH family protein [Algoriphagus halophilus]SIN85206.1 FixH protein [Algoriphagus halophilus]